MPTEERCRSDEEGDPSVTRDRPAERREEDPVDRSQPRWARRPLQHPQLMAEDEDLEVLRVLVAARLASADDESNEGADKEVEEGQHRPIVPGWYERESGFLSPTRFLEEIEAGVLYVNRRAGATTGAWPGVQPFGGWKGSGSSGKAGLSLYYPAQFMREQSHTIVD